MRIILVTSAVCLTLLGGVAWAQPPSGGAAAAGDAATADAPLPDQVCLSNACGGTAIDLTGDSRPRTVAEAITLGNGRAVRDLGGTPAQAMDALRRRAQAQLASLTAEQLPAGRSLIDYLDGFMDISDGSTLVFDSETDPDSPQTIGSIVRRDAGGGESRVYLNENGGGTITVRFALTRPAEN